MSPELIYLELEDVLGLYADVFGLNDQEARDRLRNEPGLQAALLIAGGYITCSGRFCGRL